MPLSFAQGEVANGGTAWRALSRHFGDVINIKDFGAKGDGTTDDSAALSAALAWANASFVSASPVVVRAPAGIYYITTPPAVMTRPVVLIGDGSCKTYFKLADSFTGDLFAWTEAWQASNNPDAGPTMVSIGGHKSGPGLSGIAVVGSFNASGTQNAAMFYDRNDFIRMDDVDFFYLNGRAIAMGLVLNQTLAYARESYLSRIRAFGCGTSSLPAVEISCEGSGDSTNELNWYGINIFNSKSQCLVIRNNNTSKGIGNIRFYGLRVEGANPSRSGAAGDLLQIGDASYAGAVNNVEVYGFVGNACLSGYSTVGFYAISAAKQPYNCLISGTITSGFGQGINVAAGRSLRLRMMDIATTQTNLVVGSSTLVGSFIEIDMNGRETTITSSIDATSLNSVVRSTKSSLFGTDAFTLQVPDSTTAGGNARGAGAVDLQKTRSAATQVASGISSFVVGVNNLVSGAQTSVLGANNDGTGINSFLSGFRSADRARYGVRAHSSGFFANFRGQAQITDQVLRATTTSATPITLTADLLSAGSTNVVNIPDNSAYAIRVSLVGIDKADSTKRYVYVVNGLLSRGTGVGSTTLDLGTPETLSRGTLVGLAVALTADTTNGGLSVSFTPPTGNTDEWRVVANVNATEAIGS